MTGDDLDEAEGTFAIFVFIPTSSQGQLPVSVSIILGLGMRLLSTNTLEAAAQAGPDCNNFGTVLCGTCEIG